MGRMPMNANATGLFDEKLSDKLEIDVIENQVIPLAEAQQTEPYTSATNEAWPDQGLNRILATIDSIDTNSLGEVECLEFLFYLSSRRQDARRLAELAIEIYGSLARVFGRPRDELRETLGLTSEMITQLAIVKSSMKHILKTRVPSRRDLPSFTALVSYIAIDLREADQEILRVIFLDTKNKIINDDEMARGTVDSVSIYPKEVAKRAISYCASSVILAHNHLCDNPMPSRSDIEATLKTKDALEVCDIVLHDHVIIAQNRYLSMRKMNLL